MEIKELVLPDTRNSQVLEEPKKSSESEVDSLVKEFKASSLSLESTFEEAGKSISSFVKDNFAAGFDYYYENEIKELARNVYQLTGGEAQKMRSMYTRCKNLESDMLKYGCCNALMYQSLLETELVAAIVNAEHPDVDDTQKLSYQQNEFGGSLMSQEQFNELLASGDRGQLVLAFHLVMCGDLPEITSDNQKEALIAHLFKCADKDNIPVSQYVLGIHLFSKDETQGVEYIRKAAENGHDLAQQELAKKLWQRFSGISEQYTEEHPNEVKNLVDDMLKWFKVCVEKGISPLATQSSAKWESKLCFLQHQSTALESAGTIVIRISELLTYSMDPIDLAAGGLLAKINYQLEFEGLQKQLVNIQMANFIGVSLFSESTEISSPKDTEGEFLPYKLNFKAAMQDGTLDITNSEVKLKDLSVQSMDNILGAIGQLRDQNKAFALDWARSRVLEMKASDTVTQMVTLVQ